MSRAETFIFTPQRTSSVLSWRGEVEITSHYKSTLCNKRWRVLSLSFRAISAHVSLTPPALTFRLNYALIMLTKYFYRRVSQLNL